MTTKQLRTILIAILLACAPRSAQADERGTAKQLFDEAQSLMSAGRVAEACDKFAEAASLSRTAGVRLNLADCYEKMGKTASSWRAAEEAQALAHQAESAEAAGAIVKAAEQIKAAVKPRLYRLTLDSSAVANIAVRVQLDGEELPKNKWGSAILIDPGNHAITVSADGYESWSAQVIIGGKARDSTVRVPKLKPIASEEAGALPLSASPIEEPSDGAIPDEPQQGGLGGLSLPPGDDKSSEGSTRTLGLILGGVGVVGVGVGAVFGLMAMSKTSDYESQLNSRGRCPDADCMALNSDALWMSDASTVAFIGGGLLAAVGVTLVLVSGESQESGRSPSPPALVVAPYGGAKGFGGRMALSW